MHITIKPTAYVYLAILLFLVPIQWLTAWLIAMIFHEFCHWGAVMLCGGKVYKLTVGLGSAIMDCSDLTSGKRLFCTLSGPVGGFLLLLLGRWFPKIAICSWILSVYNLLPLLPLDGGHVLQILVRKENVHKVIEKVFLSVITAGAIYITFFLHFGALPLLIVGILWLRNRKRPCKEGICRVQ